MRLRDTVESVSVAFLRRFWGSRLMYGLNVSFDALVGWCVSGVKARFPSFASEDGLVVQGVDRQIRRGFNESSSRYVLRLLRWLDDRRSKGTALALMQQLRGYCGDQVAIRIVNNSGAWHSLSAAGEYSYKAPTFPTNWDWDGNFVKWWRFWVIIYPNGLWTTSPMFGENIKFNAGHAFGSTMTPGQAADIISIIREWSPPQAKCSHVIVAFDPASFDPSDNSVTDATWAKWYRYDNGVAVPSRLETARYFEVDHE